MSETSSNKELLDDMRWQLQKIRDKQAENDEMLGKLDAAKSALSLLEATAASPDGTVTVTAGAGGIVRSVSLGDAAMASNAATLSAAINATIREAIAEATRKQLEIVHASVGEDIEPDHILGPQATFARYGSESDQDAGQGDRPVADAPADDDEYFSRSPF
jgi:DNA-binding protein YbaB